MLTFELLEVGPGWVMFLATCVDVTPTTPAVTAPATPATTSPVIVATAPLSVRVRLFDACFKAMVSPEVEGSLLAAILLSSPKSAGKHEKSSQHGQEEGGSDQRVDSDDPAGMRRPCLPGGRADVDET